jgi:hypothetical protein
MHPRVLAHPSHKKRGGNLQATKEAASRQFHLVYAKLMCAYLGEDDLANIYVYVVDIAEAKTFTIVIPSQDLFAYRPQDRRPCDDTSTRSGAT